MTENTIVSEQENVGPETEAGRAIHQEKYRGEGETFRDCITRVAAALKDDDDHFRVFREILMDQRFLPAGRVQSAMGSPRRVTPYNCFVAGTIADSFVDGAGSIMERAKEAASTMRRGGGIGYDFSTLRPRGALIRKLLSSATGPVSFMRIFNEIGLCTASSGHRRGAQMAVLRVDHPDIEEFIRAKHNNTELTGFNVSIAVTDEFMRRVADGKPFELKWNGEVFREVDPRALWEAIMRSTWDWAEPGVLFIDRINEMNNLHYCETIAATNPCGEQPLPPHGACLLGSFNLVKYLIRKPGHVANGWTLDWDRLKADVFPVIRAMDNIVDRATYPLHEQEEEALSKRRMGIGVTGLANTIETMGYPYGSSEFLTCMGNILSLLTNCCYQASALLAKEKGSFPLYDEGMYMDSNFVKGLNPETISLIREYGIRNSHLTSIAPTGTISMSADNVSSGVEPVFSEWTNRLVKFPSGDREIRIQDYASRVFGTKPRTTAEVTAKEHVAVLAMATRWVDSAVSKTCNVDPDMKWDDFKDVYRMAWTLGCKGITTFNVGGKRFALLTPDDENEAATCTVDPESGARECG